MGLLLERWQSLSARLDAEQREIRALMDDGLGFDEACAVVTAVRGVIGPLRVVEMDEHGQAAPAAGAAWPGRVAI